MAAERCETDSDAFRIEERRCRVYEKRLAGRSFREIAKELGIGLATAHADAEAVLERIKTEANETAARARELDLQRLDVALKAIWAGVESGDLDATETFLKLQARRSKLLGLDAPEQHDMNAVIAGGVSASPAEAKQIVAEVFGIQVVHES